MHFQPLQCLQSERDLQHGQLEECQSQVQRLLYQAEENDIEKEVLVTSIEKLQAANVGYIGEATELKRQLENHISTNVRLERCLSRLPTNTEAHNIFLSESRHGARENTSDTDCISNPLSSQQQYRQLPEGGQLACSVQRKSSSVSGTCFENSKTGDYRRSVGRSLKHEGSSGQFVQPIGEQEEIWKGQAKFLGPTRGRGRMCSSTECWKQDDWVNTSAQASCSPGDQLPNSSSFTNHLSQAPCSKTFADDDELEKQTVLSDSAVPRPIRDGKKATLQYQLKELHSSFRTLRSKFR